MQHLTLKESVEEAEVETGNEVESSKEAEDGSTGQVTGHHFKKEESGTKD